MLILVVYIAECSQTPIFPLARTCRSLSSIGRHLGLLMRAKLGWWRARRAEIFSFRPHRHHPRSFVLFPVSLALIDQRSPSTIPQKNRALWTVYVHFDRPCDGSSEQSTGWWLSFESPERTSSSVMWSHINSSILGFKGAKEQTTTKKMPPALKQ